jgi:phosphoribosyl 1,2-cyclic phosphodiesterase
MDGRDAPGLVVRIWGARGSLPSPGAATRRHGGNTSCVSVRAASGDCVILDAGTGIRALGDSLLAGAAPDVPLDHVSYSLFLTHAHWDHVQGLPFFSPLYRPGARVHIYGPPALGATLERAVRDQMRPPAFPVSFDALPATINFHVASDAGVACGELVVRPLPVRHPGGAVGWRVDHAPSGAAVAYMPDNEIAGAGEGVSRAAWMDTLRGVSLLVHDSTYTRDELPNRRGWGHSSWDEAVRLAFDAGIGRVVLFHHHPDRGDRGVDRVVDEARAFAESLGGSLAVTAAAEGLVLHVHGHG